MGNGERARCRLRKADKKLLDACDALNCQKVAAALKEGADINIQDPQYHLTPIDIVAGFALEAELSQKFQTLVISVLEELLKNGACPDGAAGCGGTPGRKTPWACFREYSPGGICCRLLQQAGAQVAMTESPAE